MGKVRTGKVKRLAKEIMELYTDKVTTDFEKNKWLVRSVLTGVVSKRLSNRIAGYLTSLAKQLQKKSIESTAEQA